MPKPTILEALDAIPEAVNDSVLRVIETLTPNRRVAMTAAAGLVLAHLYAEGLIEWSEPDE